MQRALDIDGHLVHTGGTVQVKWLGVWYEGIVVKIGPRKNLCRVRDLNLKETVLSDSKHLQFIETHFMDKRISIGAHVMYKDGENWREGVVESKSAIGVIMVSWRKSGLAEENLTWFELLHVAPVIHNELYKEHNRDILEAGKSGLLHNDAIEPRPRTIENMLYESDSDREEELLTQLAASKSSLEHKHSAKDISEGAVDKKNSTEAIPLPAAPPPFPPPVFMPIPPMMHPYGNMYLPLNDYNYMKMSSSFTNPLGGVLPHPRSVKKPGLFQTSVPCVMSLTKPTNGIPPHPSSHFFKSLRNVEITKKKLINPMRAHAKSRMKKSPTVESRACSEPTHYATIAELVDLPEKHNLKIFEQEKMQKEVSIQAPSHSPHHHTTKHLPHSLQPHRSPSHLFSPHQSPSKKLPPTKSKSRLEKEKTAPPPLPPRPSMPAMTLVTTVAPITKAHTSAVSESSLQRRENHSDASNEQALTGSVAEQKMLEEKEEDLKLSDHDIHNQTKNDRGIAVLGLVSTSPTNVTVPHGRSTLLTCVARSSQDISYEWFRDGKPISENDPFFTQPAPGMLQIKMASLYLSGEYKCAASDRYSSVERIFHLTVCSDTQDSEQVKNETTSQISSVAPVKQNRQDSTMIEADVSATHTKIESQAPIIIVEEFKSETTSPNSPPTPLPPSPGRTRPSNRGDAKESDDIATEQEVSQGRKSAKRNRRRVSSALKNDMEQYLEGYGENYGALSAATHELRPWFDDYSEEEDDRRQQKKKNKKRKEKKKKKNKTEKNTNQEGSSSPNESPKKLDSPKQSKKNVKLPPAFVGKNRKKQVEVEKAGQKPSEAWAEKVTPKSEPTNAPPAEVDEEGKNSVAVHTSVGVSSGSEVSIAVGEREGGKLELPQEQESLNDSVRRLQLSVEEYCPEQLYTVC